VDGEPNTELLNDDVSLPSGGLNAEPEPKADANPPPDVPGDPELVGEKKGEEVVASDSNAPNAPKPVRGLNALGWLTMALNAFCLRGVEGPPNGDDLGLSAGVVDPIANADTGRSFFGVVEFDEVVPPNAVPDVAGVDGVVLASLGKVWALRPVTPVPAKHAKPPPPLPPNDADALGVGLSTAPFEPNVDACPNALCLKAPPTAAGFPNADEPKPDCEGADTPNVDWPNADCPLPDCPNADAVGGEVCANADGADDEEPNVLCPNAD
jgi:hypothetical protein